MLLHSLIQQTSTYHLYVPGTMLDTGNTQSNRGGPYFKVADNVLSKTDIQISITVVQYDKYTYMDVERAAGQQGASLFTVLGCGQHLCRVDG